jgi:hypothetical protein
MGPVLGRGTAFPREEQEHARARRQWQKREQLGAEIVDLVVRVAHGGVGDPQRLVSIGVDLRSPGRIVGRDAILHGWLGRRRSAGECAGSAMSPPPLPQYDRQIYPITDEIVSR